MKPPTQRPSVLIIKHGYSEVCDHNISSTISYGDVFRCTCLLDFYRDYHVTWISAHAAEDLLVGNCLIDQLILADSPAELPDDKIFDHYDTIVNLEKQRDWCEFTQAKAARQKYGFRNWAASGDDAYYPESAAALSEGLSHDKYIPLQQTLFKCIDQEWAGERYSLGYQPHVKEIYDIGLNCHVGSKWPIKNWSQKNWQKLHQELEARNYAVCWQQSLDSLKHYIEWLSSCRLIITCDSLGLHLAIALQKKIVSLFGPTSADQLYLYGLGVKLTPEAEHKCMPCFMPKCQKGRSCMEDIRVETVLDSVEMLLNRQPATITERLLSEVAHNQIKL